MRMEGTTGNRSLKNPRCLVLFDVRDVLTSSPTEPENPDDETPGGDTPFIGN